MLLVLAGDDEGMLPGHHELYKFGMFEADGRHYMLFFHDLALPTETIVSYVARLAWLIMNGEVGDCLLTGLAKEEAHVGFTLVESADGGTTWTGFPATGFLDDFLITKKDELIVMSKRRVSIVGLHDFVKKVKRRELPPQGMVPDGVFVSAEAILVRSNVPDTFGVIANGETVTYSVPKRRPVARVSTPVFTTATKAGDVVTVTEESSGANDSAPRRAVRKTIPPT